MTALEVFKRARGLHRKEVTPASAKRLLSAADKLKSDKMTAPSAKALAAIKSVMGVIAEGKQRRMVVWKDATMKALYADKVYKRD